MYQATDIAQIILIRHAEPDIVRDGLFDRDQAREYQLNYDKAGIKELSNNPICTDKLPPMRIYHSSKTRAVVTAESLFPKHKFKLTPQNDFREFERRPIDFIDFKMPIRWWNLLSRFLWFLDIKQKDYESFEQAKMRVQNNAYLLSSEALKNGSAILVAHGIHNKFLEMELKRSSWKKIFGQGNSYLNISILAKKKQ